MQLQKRDLEILYLVYDYRFIPSHHVTALIPGSERKILERLQRLFHHGYLDRLVDERIRTHSGSDRMVYAITTKAANLLVDERAIEPSKVNWASRNRAVTDRNIKHSLMIAKFRTVITQATEARDDSTLLFWKESRGTGRNIDPELSDRVVVKIGEERAENGRVLPDAFLAVQDGKSKHFLYLEADRSTMTNERFLKKLKAYWAWWKQGGSQKKHGVGDFRVLTITKSNARRDNLKRMAVKASPGKNGSGMFWFACEQDYSISDPKSLLARIWLTARDEKRHCLLE
ncbi:MAG: replication-relaxation family protein [Syntrophobacteraceae bacterium]